ncbi:MAG TPA: hypothetical protein GX697_06105 [Firmicutes bacterium]|nr:hypothetical protein [Bacillota bacterium]
MCLCLQFGFLQFDCQVVLFDFQVIHFFLHGLMEHPGRYGIHYIVYLRLDTGKLVRENF